MKHLTAKIVLLSLGLTMASIGCSGSKTQCKPDVQITNPAVPQSAYIAKYARWLPSDTLGVIVIDVRPVLETYFHSFEVGSTDAKSAKARRAQVEKDLSDLSVKRMGLDITKAKQIIIGAGLAWQSVIITGIGSKVKVTGAKDIDGFETFKLASSSKKDEAMFRGMPIYGIKIKQDDAVVMVNKPAAIEGIIKTKSLTLANEPAILKRLVGLMPNRPARISAAVTLDNPIVQRGIDAEKAPFPLPSAMAIEFGDVLMVQFHGQKTDLKQMHDYAMKEYSKWLVKAEEAYNKRNDENLAVAMLSVTAYHNAKKYREMLKPTFTEKTVTYQYATPTRSSTALIVGAAVGVGAFALPLYMGVRNVATEAVKVSPAQPAVTPVPKPAVKQPAQP